MMACVLNLISHWELRKQRPNQNWSRKTDRCGPWWGRLFAVTVSLCWIPASTSYADFVYLDVDAAYFDLTSISEVSNVDLPMFGQPDEQGKAISIPGFGFRATASGDLDFHSALLEMHVFAETGTMIDNLTLRQFGSYLNFGEQTRSLIQTAVFVEVDGEIFSGASLFSQAGDGAGNWEQELQLQFPATDSFRLVIDSQVLASSAASQLAFIDQAGINLNFQSVNAVPEAESVFAIASTVFLLMIMGSKRNKRKG